MGKKKDKEAKKDKKQSKKHGAKAAVKKGKKPMDAKKAKASKKSKKARGEKKGHGAKKSKGANRPSIDGQKLQLCPCCKKHCPLTKPKCGKGRRLAEKLGI